MDWSEVKRAIDLKVTLWIQNCEQKECQLMIVEKRVSVEYENHCASLDLCFSKSFSSFPSHPPQFYHCKVFVALQQSVMYIGTRSGCGKERHTCKIGIIGTNVSLLWLKIKY